MDTALILAAQTFTRQVVMLEEAIISSGEQLDELPATHYFTENGMYARALLIPKGIVATGKVHRTPHFFMLLSGDLSVKVNNGTVERLTPPFITASPPGTQRIVYAHEDTVALCVHKTDETDLKQLEYTLVTRTYDEYLALVGAKETTMIGGV